MLSGVFSLLSNAIHSLLNHRWRILQEADFHPCTLARFIPFSLKVGPDTFVYTQLAGKILHFILRQHKATFIRYRIQVDQSSPDLCEDSRQVYYQTKAKQAPWLTMGIIAILELGD